MEAYAVVQTGGKQYLVQANSRLVVERIPAEAGASVELQPVLAISDGESLKIGAPNVEGAKVKATVIEQRRGPKLVAFRKRRRKASSKQQGHRQSLSVIKVESFG